VKRVLAAWAFAVALLIPIALLANAAAAKAKGATVRARLLEFTVRRQPSSVAAGKVTFKVKNIGSEKHELVVVRTQAGVELPTEADGSVNEDAIPEADKIGEVEDLKPKKAKSLTKTLDPGDYVLFCNVVDKESDGSVLSHYAQGMHQGFTVG
jgi:uncharacterized cupredoxin-like copper-binding protein